MKDIRMLHRALPAAIVMMAIFLVLLSCKKDKDKGTNVIEIPEAKTGNAKLISIEFLPGPETITAITLKNQSTGSAGSVHVKLSLDTPSVVTAKAKFLPANSYTLNTLEYDIAANSTVDVPITINRTNLTVDTLYGIGFKIETVSSGTIANDAKSLVVKIDLRNRWDGRYRITGTFTDYAAPTLTFTEHEVDLITTNPTQIKFIPKELGIPGYLILSGTSLSYYGSFGPVLNFNAATNKITSVINFYGQPAANTRSAQMDPSGTNQWDTGTKSITVKFWMNQPNTVTTPPYHRTLFINTLIYLGPRF